MYWTGGSSTKSGIGFFSWSLLSNLAADSDRFDPHNTLIDRPICAIANNKANNKQLRHRLSSMRLVINRQQFCKIRPRHRLCPQVAIVGTARGGAAWTDEYNSTRRWLIAGKWDLETGTWKWGRGDDHELSQDR